MGQRMPADLRRLVPKLRGGVSWIRTGKMIELRVAAMRGGPCCSSPAIGNLCKLASSSNTR
jgi:hypothetical protein